MGLVKALQGAPSSFAGYSDVMAKKSQRDFLSQEAELANTRSIAMENLKQKGATKLQNDRINASKESQQSGFTHTEQMEKERQRGNMALANQNFSNSSELQELKRSGDQQALDSRMESNLEFFEGTTKPYLIEAGMGDAMIGIAGNAARLGHDITPLVTASLKAKSGGGGISEKDKAELYLKAQEQGRKITDDLSASPLVEEQYKILQKEYPQGTTMQKVITSELLLGMGMEPDVTKKVKLIDISDPTEVASVASEIKASLDSGEKVTDLKKELSSRFNKATVDRVILEASNKKEEEVPSEPSQKTSALAGSGEITREPTEEEVNRISLMSEKIGRPLEESEIVQILGFKPFTPIDSAIAKSKGAGLRYAGLQ